MLTAGHCFNGWGNNKPQKWKVETQFERGQGGHREENKTQKRKKELHSFTIQVVVNEVDLREVSGKEQMLDVKR